MTWFNCVCRKFVGCTAVAAYGLVLLILVFFTPVQSSETLPQPEGDVILTVSGNIKNTNTGGAAVLDRNMLKGLPQETLVVVTPWTEGNVTFVGPLISDVLTMVGAGDTATLKAVALDEYAVEIPTEDVQKYKVILAMTMGGKDLDVQDMGPLWVIYPWTDQHPELQDEKYHGRSIWQLSAIEVQ